MVTPSYVIHAHPGCVDTARNPHCIPPGEFLKDRSTSVGPDTLGKPRIPTHNHMLAGQVLRVSVQFFQALHKL